MSHISPTSGPDPDPISVPADLPPLPPGDDDIDDDVDSRPRSQSQSQAPSPTSTLTTRPLAPVQQPLQPMLPVSLPRPLGLAYSYSSSHPPNQSANLHGTSSHADPSLASSNDTTSMVSSSASLPTSSLNPESSDAGTGNASIDIHPGSLDLLSGGSSASLPIFGEHKTAAIAPGESTSALGSFTALNDPSIPPTMLQSLDAIASSHMPASAYATQRKVTTTSGAIDVSPLAYSPTATATAQRQPNTRMRGGSAEDSNGTVSLIHLAMTQSTDSVLFAPSQQQQLRTGTIDRLPTVADSIAMSPTSISGATSDNGPLATLVPAPSAPTPTHVQMAGQQPLQHQQANGLPTPTSPPTTLLGAPPTAAPAYLHSPTSVPLPPSRASSHSQFSPSTPIPPVPPLPTWLSPTKPTSALPTLLSPCIDPVSSSDFVQIVDSIRDAIQEDAQPMRIGQGSSGSYFCRNTDGLILGVFKPKDEEPYGELNPKWTKWIHRHVFFCCFGRSCLIPNVGYMSEAGASLLDQRLGFGIVPLTKVVSLASPAFYYRKRHRRHPQALPMKTGSLQLFLRGFKDASMFLKIHPLPDKPPNGSVVWEVLAAATVVSSSGSGTPDEGGGQPLDDGSGSADVLPSMHASTEALVVNAATMSHDPAAGGDTRINMPSLPPSPQPGSPITPGAAGGQGPTSPTLSNGGGAASMRPLLDAASAGAPGTYAGYQGIWDAATYDSFLDQFQRLTILDYLMRNTDRGLDNWMIKFVNGRIQVAAIDHGLAFPFKHPDKWRSYPYGWLYMSISKLPYLPHLRTYMTTLLRDPRWWAITRTDLHDLFAQDDAFDGDVFEAQMAVIRGQMYNLLRVLDTEGGSPWDLWFQTPIIVVRHPHRSGAAAAGGGVGERMSRVLGERVANGLRTGSLRSASAAGGGYGYGYSAVASDAGAPNGGVAAADADRDELDDQFHVAGEWLDPWDASVDGDHYSGRATPNGHGMFDEYEEGDSDEDHVSGLLRAPHTPHRGHGPPRSVSMSRVDAANGRTRVLAAGGSAPASRPTSPPPMGIPIPNHPHPYPSGASPYRFHHHQRTRSERGRSRMPTGASVGAILPGSSSSWKPPPLPPHHYGGAGGSSSVPMHFGSHDDLMSLDADISDRVKAIWDKGKRKMKDGGSSLMRRARNVIVEAKRKPWFQNW